MQCAEHITACYAFVRFPQDRLPSLHDELTAFGRQHGMTGLVLIAEEGLNATVAGSADAVAAWKRQVHELCGNTTFKDSVSHKSAFSRWSVKIKPEIVALKQEDVVPRGPHKHLSPEEFHAMLEKEDVVVLDTRNTYETAIGKFHGALDPRIEHFSAFPDFVKTCGIPKKKNVLMYCTGGIRCEKALLEMEKQGFEYVYQLEGGILAYLEKFPNAKFEGECFVFDHRVAVDQHLQPSTTYGLCPHCGHAGDTLLRCHCGKEQKICSKCSSMERARTCSKRCANVVGTSVR